MIEIKNISKTFGTNKIIRNLSLTVQTGERVAIIGPSACGKSTLLRMIMGLQKPDKGSILIDGVDITKLSGKKEREMRLKFGMLFQSGALFDSMNVEENVAFPLVENYDLTPYQIKKRTREKLEVVGMTGTELQMPSSLSGGQRKRIGLARAIAGNPEAVLYDEPTTGLDPILSTIIEDLIVKLNTQHKITSVIVTHQISTILRTADTILMMHEGALLAPESPKSVYHSKNPIVRKFIEGGIPNGT